MFPAGAPLVAEQIDVPDLPANTGNPTQGSACRDGRFFDPWPLGFQKCALVGASRAGATDAIEAPPPRDAHLVSRI
jgi:hypothetical protein